MRMLFSTPDSALVQKVKNRLLDSGVECEVRWPAAVSTPLGRASYSELWVRETSDFSAAMRRLGSQWLVPGVKLVLPKYLRLQAVR